jgi:hypothetical protein
MKLDPEEIVERPIAAGFIKASEWFTLPDGIGHLHDNRNASDSEHLASGPHLADEVGLDTATGDHALRPQLDHSGYEKLNLSPFVSSTCKPSQIVAFYPEVDPEALTRPVQAMEGGWKLAQRDAPGLLHV